MKWRSILENVPPAPVSQIWGKNLRQSPLYTNGLKCSNIIVMDIVYFDAFRHPNTSWIYTGFDQATKSHALAHQLYNAQALLRAKLGRAQLELDNWRAPTPAVACEGRSDAAQFYWLQYGGESSVQSTSFNAMRSENLDEWQQWWRLDSIRFIRLQKIISLLRQHYRWVGYLVALLVDRLARPLFPYQLILRERAWTLLHGSHPPRQDAGISRPAFAEPGRVCCEPAC